jgi:RES domain-containing protein
MYPGRWNRKGQRAIYASFSKALAVVEVLAHLPTNSKPRGYSMLTITVQGNELMLRRTLEGARRWFQTVGQVLQEDTEDPIGLIAPSVIVPEYNMVLYPRPVNFEPELVRIEAIEEFEFDTRLVGHALPL